MSRPVRLSALILLFTLVVAGCSGDGGDDGPQLPAAPQLLNRSAEAMSTVQTARFMLDVEGTVGGLSVQGANAQLTREGEAAGTVTLDQAGQLAELEFVLTDGILYLQGPTGGFRQLPASLAQSIYDPAAVLDPERGIPALLRGAKNPTTEAREQVGGVDTYRVRATFPAAVLSGLVPGVTADAPGQVWIGVDDSRLVQARFTLPDATATVRLSEFDAPADIAPPP